MQIIKQSSLTGKTHSKDIDVTQKQIDQWLDGMHIQHAMPNLSPDDREFIMSGITSEEWNWYFKEYEFFEEEDEEEVEDLRDPNGNS